MTGKHPPYYRPLKRATLRASVHSLGEATLPPWPADEAWPGAWRTWLGRAWAVIPLAEAVALASPALAEQIETTLGRHQPDAVRVRRLVMALTRYTIRARGRATPFGDFAGAGPVSFGSHVRVRLGGSHQVRTRADTVWLAGIVARLEASPALLSRLPLVTNDLAVERAGRLVVPWQPHLSTPAGRPQDDVEVSLRLIPVARTVRQAARLPIRTGDLVDKVSADHPGATREALETVVWQLVRAGALISGLRAPSTETDVLSHLLRQLRGADADDLPEVSDLTRELRLLHGQLSALGETGAGRRAQERRVIAQRMRQMVPTDQPLTVDLRLGGTLVLPYAVAAEAASAADALIRLSPVPVASESWRDYHRRFLDRYGPSTLVPVAELVDLAWGLGFPRHFTQPPPAITTARDTALLALAQEAVLDGSREITLDAAAFHSLTSTDQQVRRPVSAVELWADLRAESVQAVADGHFTLGVCGFGRAAANGRFLDLLEKADRQEMTALYLAMPPGVDGALAAQLSFPPRHPHTENVLRVRPILPDLIYLGEHRAARAGHIPVGDLAVVADAARLYVVSRSKRRVVEAMLPHAGARHTMPPLARFLFEIPRSVHPAVTGFDWGAAACLPQLPRVRYGRSILAPAHWRLSPASLPGPGAPIAQWSEALEEVRAHRHMPAGTAVGEGDHRLRLDLDKAMDREVLRSQMDNASGPVTVIEAPTAVDHHWYGGRAHELVFPLSATAPPGPAPVVLNGSVPPPVVDHGQGPRVVFMKLYGCSELFDTILVEHLPRLLQRWSTPPRWWFARYRHPAQHLRIRFRDADHERVAGYVVAWAAELRRRGLLGEIAFDTYRPETGRYGSGVALDAAEELFAADSAAVLAQLAFTAVNREFAPQALTAASLVDLAAAMTGSRSAGLHWLTAHPQYAAGAGAHDRDVRQQTFHLADRERINGLPGGTALTGAWAARTKAAASYTASLAAGTTGPRPETVLGSLLHLHHVRALGINSGAEAVTYKLARAVALAHTRRTDKKGRSR